MKILLSLLLYLVATLIYFFAEASFVKSAMDKQWWASGCWLAFKVVTIPMYGLGTYWLYQYNQTWWLAEFPYWLMSIIISYVAYDRILKTGAGWREAVCAGLIVLIAVILGTKE